MTQNQLLQILKQEKRWMTAKQVAAISKTGKSTGTCLNILYDWGFIKKEPRKIYNENGKITRTVVYKY